MDFTQIIDFEAWKVIFVDVISKFLTFLPNLIFAFIVFALGMWFAAEIGKLIAKILSQIPFDKIFEEKGWSQALGKASFKTKPSGFFGEIVKWVLSIIVLIISINILGLQTEFETITDPIISYLPNIFIASLIFIVVVFAVDILEKFIVVSASKMGVSYARFLGTIIKSVVWVIGMLAIFAQLGIATSLMETLYTSIIYAFAAALALSFGLGGKDVASDILKDLRDKMRD
jgi:hypothetical protein